MFQSELQEYLITKLNLNTQDLLFKGESHYDIDLKGNFVVQSQIAGTYSLEDIEYLPTQIVDWRNTPQPYTRIDLQDLAVPLRIACRETQLDDALQAIDTFRLLLNGASDTIDSKNVGFRIAQPTIIGIPEQLAGNTWLIIEIVIMLSAGANLLYGNSPLSNFKIALTGETLESVVANRITITATTETNPKSDTGEVTVKNNKRTMTYNVELFYEDNVDVCNEFLDWLWADLTMTQKFDISVKYTDTITKTETVIITSMQQTLSYGVPIGYVIDFYNG